MKLGCIKIEPVRWLAMKILLFFLPLVICMLIAGALWIVSLGMVNALDCVNRFGDWVCEILD